MSDHLNEGNESTLNLRKLPVRLWPHIGHRSA